MTKKDHTIVAKVIRDRSIYLKMYIMKCPLVDGLCEALKKDNTKFDEKKFREACISREEVE
jgi:hypothetical protein